MIILEKLHDWIAQAGRVLEAPLFKLGGIEVTLWLVAYMLALILALFWIAKRVHTLLADRVRFRIPVSVAYGTDARKVEKLLLEVADGIDDVLKEPPPVRFMEFGDNGIRFELRAWSSSLVHRKGQLASRLYFAIYEKFSEAGVEIPFPQRKLHVRGGRIEVGGQD